MNLKKRQRWEKSYWSVCGSRDFEGLEDFRLSEEQDSGVV